MSQQDNFAGGFIVGSIFGGLVGGVAGALIGARLQRRGLMADDDLETEAIGEGTEERMESARQGLEDKIAQLNDAIDDMRQQLGGGNGYSQSSSPSDHSSMSDA